MLVAAITLALAAAASQPPLVYLQCDIVESGKAYPWEFTLNESEGTVDYSKPNGSWRTPARFTADAVYFIGFKLSRTDLSIVREGTDILGNPKTDRGQCRLVQQKARAF